MKPILITVMCCITVSTLNAQKQKYLSGGYWRKQAMEDVLHNWSTKATDSVNGMFFTNLNQNWEPFGSFIQSPAMIARHLFAYSTGYLMSGDERLLLRAKQLLAYLDKNAWDKEYGGWYDQLDRQGVPTKFTKTTFNQVYCITGLTLYYFVTKDSTVLNTILKANNLLERKVWDNIAGGYYDVMNRDWSVQSTGKSFSSEITPASGYYFYLYLATRDQRYLDQLRKIMNMVKGKMIDANSGWVLESFDRNWKYNYSSVENKEINIGHNIETAWMYLRLYLLAQDEKFLAEAKKLGNKVEQFGFNASNGCWYAYVAKLNPSLHSDLSYWWIQAYGNMYNLIFYSIEPQQKRLDDFRKGAEFWDTFFVDKQNGDTYQGVNVAGEPVDPVKGNFFKASYHNLENSLLVWLYLDLWVNKKPVKLYFSVENSDNLTLYPLPIEEKDYRILTATWNGKKIGETSGNAVKLPEHRGKVEVVLESR